MPWIIGGARKGPSPVLDFQTAFTRSFGQGLHFAVEEETATVEVGFGHAGLLRTFCDCSADLGQSRQAFVDALYPRTRTTPPFTRSGRIPWVVTGRGCRAICDRRSLVLTWLQRPNCRLSDERKFRALSYLASATEFQVECLAKVVHNLCSQNDQGAVK